MEELSKEERIKQYNDIPVYYCASCMSLNIRTTETGDIDYCDTCGDTKILTSHINEWKSITHNKNN